MEAIIVAIIGAATTIAGTVLGIVSHRRKKQCAEGLALRNGVQSLLRAEIIRTYEKWYSRYAFGSKLIRTTY